MALINKKGVKKMRNETKIFADTAPVVLYTLIDCSTYGELINYLEKRRIKWELVEQSETSNTIRMKYKGNYLFHDFEIVN
tara:strand:- start:252 stop:491 length:240 start_codon:yes stop_codon:yes gene_type:complete